jgi:hypothetical protein
MSSTSDFKKNYSEFNSKFKNTQLNDATTYNAENIQFSEPITGTIQIQENINSKFYRVLIGTKNEDGTFGHLLLKLPDNLFSFGVQENVDPKTKKLNGYSISLCLTSKNGMTAEEEAAIDTLDDITEKCIEHMISPELQPKIGRKGKMQHLDRKAVFNVGIIWRKKDEDNEIIKNATPMIYPKLIENKSSGKIISLFLSKDEIDESGFQKELDPLTLIKQWFSANPVIKIDNIFIGQRYSIQVKLWETEVRVIQKSGKVNSFLHAKKKKMEPQSDIILGTKNLTISNPLLNSNNTLVDDEEKKEIVASPKPMRKKRT